MEFLKSIIFTPVTYVIIAFILIMGFTSDRMEEAVGIILFLAAIISPVVIGEIVNTIRRKSR